jgi:diguanylate cyclase (GGDEF)-like protein/PAS domain S-box-containing protein
LSLPVHFQGFVHMRHTVENEKVETGIQHCGAQELMQERTAELIQANKRLQLEVLERDLADTQIERKSNLLDAINHILQLTLTDLSDQALANVYLQAARRLTASPFGIIAEQRDGRWHIAAIHHIAGQSHTDTQAPDPNEYEIAALWRRIRETGGPLTLSRESRERSWQPLPQSHPELRSLLAIPLSSDYRVLGFAAVANNPQGYTSNDQYDMQMLNQVFIETLTHKRMEAAKTISEKRLNLALESANDGLWDYSPISRTIYYSPRWYGLLDYAKGELPDVMETWHALTHPENLALLEETFASLVCDQKDSFCIEIRMLSKTGQWHWLQVKGKTVERDPTGAVSRIVGTLSDISKFKEVEVALQKANDELQRLAALDDLTQIANRRRFDARLEQEWRRARRDRRPLGVIICDIDKFKNYNDAYGHLQGDQALYRVAQAANNALKRPMDLVARYGGEEFAIILPDTDTAGARRVAQEVREAVAAMRITHGASDICDHVTLSFGVAAMVPASDRPSRIFLEIADRALYRAKAQGRNCIVCAADRNQEMTLK